MNPTAANLAKLRTFSQSIAHDTEDHGLKQAQEAMRKCVSAWGAWGISAPHERTWQRTFSFAQMVDAAADAAYAAYELREEALGLTAPSYGPEYAKQEAQVRIAHVLSASEDCMRELERYMREE